ncbi:hypothetical protein LJC30_05745 [Odoribacter sp. OttesenSCG-928-L07]|nr:hypothetical protein [Odoribacter sp. OttesenSCG-928-L07]MDL2238758.1 hypothetical protein [Bacteroidales bacterium OttesenSCG-928-L14]MDL2241162.1 hypothetical protein [Bacteroidales bacterium OttesenSCG-928-K22]
MAIKNVKISNSRVGVHSPKEPVVVLQLVTAKIQYDDKEELVVSMGLKKRTTLCFFNKTYFGTMSANILELWDECGNLLTTLPKPKGKIVSVFNNWFIVLNKDIFNAYDQTGVLVAIGKLPDEGQKNIVLKMISK